MIAMRHSPSLIRLGFAVAVVAALAGCTPGGQFDPTALFANDTFDTKKRLQGERQPVFPNGVPGTASGVPQDLVKGYQPPPDQAADVNGAPNAAAAEAAKPKPKPKPKVVRAPAQPQDPAFSQRPGAPPTRINVGPAGNQAAPAPQGAAPSQSARPSSPQAAAPSQTNWPAPPQSAPAQPTAQPSQSVWPNPPAPATTSQ
jgi:hypothetical protein